MTAKSTTIKKKGGMPRHEPTPEIQARVKVMVTAGLSHDRVAAVLGMDKKTLYKYYRMELDAGKEEALTNNTASLISAARKGNTAAMIYVQKCLGGAAWREKQETEHTGDVRITVHYGDRKNV